MEKKRLESFDIARALCIILVVTGHYIPENAPAWYQGIHDCIYAFHMPAFMFISGYIYIATKKQESYPAFLWRKVKRLMIPYFSTSIIVISLKLLTQGVAYVENPVTAISYLRIFYLPEAGYFLWFIWALWWMFVLLPHFKTRTSRLFLLLGSIALWAAPVEFPKICCMEQFRLVFPYFMTGVVLHDYPQIAGLVKKTPPAVGGLLFFSGLWLFLHYGNHFLSPLPALSGIGMAMILSGRIARKRRGIRTTLLTVSASSYTIYLFHTTFEGFAKAALNRVPHFPANDAAFSIGALLVISLGIICPILLQKYVIRKSKILRLLFG